MKPSLAVVADVNILPLHGAVSAVVRKHESARSRSIGSNVFWILMLLELFSPAIRATTIVGIRFDNGIIIGADSLTVSVPAGERTQVCKIHQMGAYFFATARLNDMTVRGRQTLNVRAIVARVLRGPEPVEKKVALLDRVMVRELQGHIADIITIDPRYFIKEVFGKYVTEVLVARLDRGKPYMFSRYYRIVHDSKGNLVVRPEGNVCFGDACGPGAIVMALGRWDAAFDILIKPGMVISDKLEMAIEAEIRKSPDWVGGPLSIVVLDGLSGPNWIKTGKCTQGK